MNMIVKHQRYLKLKSDKSKEVMSKTMYRMNDEHKSKPRQLKRVLSQRFKSECWWLNI